MACELCICLGVKRQTLHLTRCFSDLVAIGCHLQCPCAAAAADSKNDPHLKPARVRFCCSCNSFPNVGVNIVRRARSSFKLCGDAGAAECTMRFEGEAAGNKRMHCSLVESCCELAAVFVQWIEHKLCVEGILLRYVAVCSKRKTVRSFWVRGLKQIHNCKC